MSEERRHDPGDVDLDDYRYVVGGHYWDRAPGDLETPEWYEHFRRNQDITSPTGRGTASTESGPIPPEVEWSEIRSYRCRHCQDECLNYYLDDCAQNKECRSCHRIPALDASPEAEDPAAPPDGGATEAEAGTVPLTGGARRDGADGHDRSATQRTRPGTARSAARPESRTVARRDSGD